VVGFLVTDQTAVATTIRGCSRQPRGGKEGRAAVTLKTHPLGRLIASGLITGSTVLALWVTTPYLASAQADSATPMRTTREGHVTADDGVRLYYRVVGSGLPVVIVPGGLFLERDFARLGRTRTIVFYDMRNRGRSDTVADSTRISIQHDVRDLEAVRRHLGAKRVMLVGWSYLGMMVMRYAAEHPAQVTRIVQIGPLPRKFKTPFPDSLVAHDSVPVPDSASVATLARQRAAGLAARDPRADCEQDYRVNRVRLVGAPRLAEQVPNVCGMRNEWPTVLDRHFYLLFSSIIGDEGPAWAHYAALRIPVLTIHGTQDRNAAYGGGREWVAHLPEARLLTVRGVAHMPWLEAPDTVFPAIESFLRGEWPRGAARVRR
jgi:proline iminopeptidase